MNCSECMSIAPTCHASANMARPFEAGQLEVRLYSRDEDRKARVLCREDRGGRRRTSCQAVTNLRISRLDSCLQLCIPDGRRRLILWSNLRFTSYERGPSRLATRLMLTVMQGWCSSTAHSLPSNLRMNQTLSASWTTTFLTAKPHRLARESYQLYHPANLTMKG